MECWGWNDYGKSSPTAGEFASVSAGEFHSCGVRPDGSMECWGSHKLAKRLTYQVTPPDGEFASVSAGGIHSCGVKLDGSVECWEPQHPPQVTNP